MSTAHDEVRRWDIEDAENLLSSLQGIVSVRVVTRPGGEIEEIHVLTTREVSPKQTVRNVESALLAHLNLDVDHRKISVARSDQTAPGLERRGGDEMVRPRRNESRLIFESHVIESEWGRRVRHRVEISWKGERFQGEASATDLPRTRLEAVARATLAAVDAALASQLGEGREHHAALELDGVRTVDAFERRFILVAVNGLADRDVVPLTGATVVEESSDRSTILATLSATDRWTRGRL